MPFPGCGDILGIVLQEPFLFSKTLRETISDGAKNRDMEAIRHCARLAAIDDTIQNFSEGYETLIGERGVTISGGQKAARGHCPHADAEYPH